MQLIKFNFKKVKPRNTKQLVMISYYNIIFTYQSFLPCNYPFHFSLISFNYQFLLYLSEIFLITITYLKNNRLCHNLTIDVFKRYFMSITTLITVLNWLIIVISLQLDQYNHLLHNQMILKITSSSSGPTCCWNSRSHRYKCHQ